jgi:hypothetical protein
MMVNLPRTHAIVGLVSTIHSNMVLLGHPLNLISNTRGAAALLSLLLLSLDRVDALGAAN